MWTARSAYLLLTSLALCTCAVPKFPEADSGTSVTPPPEETYKCEPQSKVVCTSGTCEKICHRTNVQRQAAYSPCEKPVVIDGARYDNCEDDGVCVEPAPNTAQGYFCLPLCRDVTACPGGVACGDRELSKGSSIRVCDPIYQNCAGTCCDPTDPSRNPCPFNRACFLVPAPEVNRDMSWTVCEFAGGGSQKGEPCTYARDCIEGLTCIGDKDSGTCRVTCDPSKDKPCPDGGTCKPYPKQWGYCL